MLLSQYLRRARRRRSDKLLSPHLPTLSSHHSTSAPLISPPPLLLSSSAPAPPPLQPADFEPMAKGNLLQTWQSPPPQSASPIVCLPASPPSSACPRPARRYQRAGTTSPEPKASCHLKTRGGSGRRNTMRGQQMRRTVWWTGGRRG